MRLMSRMNPVGGIADFWHEIRRPTPYRWPILGASILLTGTLFSWFVMQDYFRPPDPPHVTYITTFAEGRTEAEILRTNIENQHRKDELAAEAEAIEQRQRDIYKALGRATGLDVDAMEAEAKAEREREETAKRERLKELFERSEKQAGTVAAGDE